MKLGLTLPADIVVSTSEDDQYIEPFRSIIEQLKPSRVGDILFYGKTKLDPQYSFIVFFDQEEKFKKISNLPDTLIAIDTVVNQHKLLIAGSSVQERVGNMKNDLNEVLASVTFDENYNPKEPENPLQLMTDNLYKTTPSRYIKPYKQLLSKAENYKTKSEQWVYYQALFTMASMISNSEVYDSLEKKYERPRSLKADPDTLKNLADEQYTDEAAIDKLKSIIKQNQLVMFNELHWDKSHRKQFIKLLPYFKEAGFTYLGMEALQGDSLLNERGYPVYNTGFYINEPMMAQIIREAKNLGFQLFQYENFSHEDREIGQAKNIYDNTFKNEPEAKVLIYAGIGHIHEKSDGIDSRRMAARVKELYNIDPLTIDQHILGMQDHLYKDYELILLDPATLNYKLRVNINTDFYLGSHDEIEKYVQSGELQHIVISDFKVDSLYLEEEVASMLYHKSEIDAQGYAAIPLYIHEGFQTEYRLAPGEYVWVVTNLFGEIISREAVVCEK